MPHADPNECIPLPLWKTNATAVAEMLKVHSEGTTGVPTPGWAADLKDRFAYDELVALYWQLRLALDETHNIEIVYWQGGLIVGDDFAFLAAWLRLELDRAAPAHDPIPGWLKSCELTIDPKTGTVGEAGELFRRVREALDARRGVPRGKSTSNVSADASADATDESA